MRFYRLGFGALILLFAYGCGGLTDSMLRSRPRVVMMTEVSACGRYVGSFAVLSTGKWKWIAAAHLPKEDADRALKQLPQDQRAYLDPTSAELGDCPPHIATNWRQP